MNFKDPINLILLAVISVLAILIIIFLVLNSNKDTEYVFKSNAVRPNSTKNKYNGYFITDNACATQVSSSDAYPYIFINQDPSNTYTLQITNLAPTSDCKSKPLDIANVSSGQTYNWNESGDGSTPYSVPYVGTAIQVYINGDPKNLANLSINGQDEGNSWVSDLDAGEDILTLVGYGKDVIGFIGMLF